MMEKVLVLTAKVSGNGEGPGDTLPGNTAVTRDYVASVCTS